MIVPYCTFDGRAVFAGPRLYNQWNYTPGCIVTMSPSWAEAAIFGSFRKRLEPEFDVWMKIMYFCF